MNKLNILFFIFVMNFSILNSSEKRTVTSFFVHCKDKSCCEANRIDCKSKLTDSQEICQRGYEICKNFSK